MIAIVDYGMGNLGSIKRKMDLIGTKSIITSKIEELRECNKLILPGVGHFAKAVSEIKRRGLWDFISDQVLAERKMILGICLGMQLLAKKSEEGNAEGFGWIDAEVIKFRVSDGIKFKVPHTGWNTINLTNRSSLFNGIDSDSEFYFVHSYHLQCNNSDCILAETLYDYSFVSAVHKENIYGVQFHPEKSHNAGEKLLRNFIDL
jgi:imidazole glycerol-phosphate synthase subunit HisH